MQHRNTPGQNGTEGTMSLLRRLYAGWMAVAGRFGSVQTLILLAFFYALLIGPAWLATLASRRDLLDKGQLGEPGTAWHEADSSPPDLEWAAHCHDTETITVVVEGSVRVGTKWYGPGSVRVQERGSVYGPGRTGPDGAKTVVFYADRRGLPDQFPRDEDRRTYADLPARSRALLQFFEAATLGSPDPGAER